MPHAIRHIPYIPRPGYELLTTTGLMRFPQCVREQVRIMVPPSMLAWLPFLAHMKVRVLLHAFTIN
jgi:hypothetical protein